MPITTALMTMPDGTCGVAGSRPCPVRRCLAVRSRVVLLAAPTRPALPVTFSILRVLGIGYSSVCSQLRWVALGWVIAFSYCVVLDFRICNCLPDRRWAERDCQTQHRTRLEKATARSVVWLFRCVPLSSSSGLLGRVVIVSSLHLRSRYQGAYCVKTRSREAFA